MNLLSGKFLRSCVRWIEHALQRQPWRMQPWQQLGPHKLSLMP